MKCPHCGHNLSRKQVAGLLRSIPSKKRAEAARLNGKKGGRPRKQIEDPEKNRLQ